MWYVLDARKDAELVYGFNQDVSESIVRKALNTGGIISLLNHVPIHKNDLFYIEAGTVHAIGAGALVAEIQESSNLTYRLYDYDRIDKNGKKRPLHIDKALQVANLKSSATPRQPMRVLKYRNGCASELLTRCKYFQVERMLLNTEVQRKLVEYLNKMGVLTPQQYKRSVGLNSNAGAWRSEDPHWNATMVRRLLTSEIYIGNLLQGKNKKINYKVKQSIPVKKSEWIKVTGTHEAIITKAAFDRVQYMLGTDTRTPPEKDQVNLFSGMIKCADCGQSMVRKTLMIGGKQYCYYVCSTEKAGQGCSPHRINAEKLEKAVLHTSMQKIYSDEGKSGMDVRHRPEFQQMIEDAGKGKMDLILCASVSRFARNIKQCLEYITKLKTMNPRHPVGVYFETENIYTLDPNSTQTLQFHAMLADWESENKSRRMILSYDQRICTGQYPVLDLLGYRHTKDGQLIIQEDEAKTVRFVFLALVAGISCVEIAEILTEKQRPTLKGNVVWNGSMVRNLTENERRWGDLEARKTIVIEPREKIITKNNGERDWAFVPGHHEGIVTPEIARAAQFMASSKYLDNGVPGLNVINEGVLRGFVSVCPRWHGIDRETFLYNDYMAARQLSMFENTETYGDMTSAAEGQSDPPDESVAETEAADKETVQNVPETEIIKKDDGVDTNPGKTDAPTDPLIMDPGEQQGVFDQTVSGGV